MRKIIIISTVALFSCTQGAPASIEQQGQEYVKELFEHNGAPVSQIASVKMDSLVKGKEAYFTVMKKTADGAKEMKLLLLYVNEGVLDKELNDEIYK